MELLEPPNDPAERQAWARQIVRCRSWWIDELGGDDVLRRAAKILGDDHPEVMERYIRKHAPLPE